MLMSAALRKDEHGSARLVLLADERNFGLNFQS